MKQLLQAFVDRRRRPELHSGHPCPFRGGLLAKLAEPLGCTFEVRPRSWNGVGQKAHREADHNRLHPRLEQADPGARAECQVHETHVHAEAAQDEDGSVEHEGHEQWQRMEGLGIDGRDDDEREDVVHDDHGEHERPQAIGEPRPDEREQAEREGGVGRHRDSPAVRRRMTGVEREVDGDRPRHASDSGQDRQREPSPVPQLAQVELAPRLEPDHEEEERHQPAVHPVAQIEGYAPPTELDRERRPPQRVIRGRVDVHPHERGNGGAEQEGGAAGLRAQKRAQRRLQGPRPRSFAGRLPIPRGQAVIDRACRISTTARLAPPPRTLRRRRRPACRPSVTRTGRGRYRRPSHSARPVVALADDRRLHHFLPEARLSLSTDQEAENPHG